MKHRRNLQRALVVVFSTVILLPVILLATGFDVPVPLEIRRLRGKPKLGSGPTAALSYALAYREYFNDSFPLRKLMVYWNASLRADFFKTRSVGSVLLGSDDWMFLRTSPSDDDLPCTLPVPPFRPREIEAWRLALADLSDRVAATGGEFHFLIAPNKASIYPEKLPFQLPRRTRLDQLAKAMTGEPFAPIDIRGDLKARKSDYRVYEAMDTHWSPRGAYDATRLLARHLARGRFGPDASRLDGYSFGLKPRDRVGDLVRVAGLAREPEEISWAWRPDGERWRELPMDPGALPKTIRRSTDVRVTENSGGYPTTVVVFHDSFFDRMMPYFSELFRKVYYVPRTWVDDDFVRRVGGEMVVLELVERKLNHPGYPGFLAGPKAVN